MLPIERLRFDFDRERDFEDLIWSLIQPLEAPGDPVPKSASSGKRRIAAMSWQLARGTRGVPPPRTQPLITSSAT
jgi:hypothetical protein